MYTLTVRTSDRTQSFDFHYPLFAFTAMNSIRKRENGRVRFTLKRIA